MVYIKNTGVLYEVLCQLLQNDSKFSSVQSFLRDRKRFFFFLEGGGEASGENPTHYFNSKPTLGKSLKDARLGMYSFQFSKCKSYNEKGNRRKNKNVLLMILVRKHGSNNYQLIKRSWIEISYLLLYFTNVLSFWLCELGNLGLITTLKTNILSVFFPRQA